MVKKKKKMMQQVETDDGRLTQSLENESGIPGWINTRQAAKLSNLSVRLITKYCQEQRFTCTNTGKQFLIDEADFEKWLKKPRPVGNPNFGK